MRAVRFVLAVRPGVWTENQRSFVTATEYIRRYSRAAGPRIVAVAATAGSLGLVCTALAATVNTVTVADSAGAQRTVMAAVTEPEVLLDLAGMELESNDSTRLHEVEDGTLLLSLQRAFPVSVAADGEYYEAEISDGTVADVLARAGVTLGPDDYTTPSLDSPVTEGMGRVRVHRVTYTENTARETVPYETEYLDETTESTGKYSHEVLVQAGQDGLVDVTYRQKYVDGGYSSTEVVDTQVVTEMIPEIYRKYNSDAVSPLQAPEGITVENNVPSSYSKMYSMKATGYYSARGRGASGLGLYYGTFACDPTLIPYGTKVYITSTDGKFVYGWAIATDTGAFVQSNRMQVDLFYETYAESVANGVKYVNVRSLRISENKTSLARVSVRRDALLHSGQSARPACLTS